MVEILKNSEEKEARAFVLALEKYFEADFFDKSAAIRIVSRLLKSKMIQSTYDQIGDKQIEIWVNKKYPKEEGDSKNLEINDMLRSNWCLSKIFTELKLPTPPQKFINERISRYGKRGASLLEWIIGLVFILTKDKPSQVVSSTTKGFMTVNFNPVDVVQRFLGEKVFAFTENRDKLDIWLAEWRRHQSGS